MSQWLIEHSTFLAFLAKILTAISVVFGAHLLGRFPPLKKRGGFYSTVLAAVSAAVAVGLFVYAVEEFSGDVTTQVFNPIFSSVFGVPLNVTLFATFAGIFVGMLPMLVAPDNFRPRKLIDHFEKMIDDRDLSKMWPPVKWNVVAFFAILAYFNFIFDTAAARDYLVEVQRRFDAETLPIWSAFVVAAVYTSIMVTLGVLWYNRMRRYAGRGLLDERPWTRLIARAATFVLLFAVSALFYVPFVLLEITAAEYTWPLFAASSIGFSAYFVSIVLGVVGYIVAMVAIFGMRAIADRLSPGVLTKVFAVPGVIATFIGFVLFIAKWLPF